MTNLRNVIVVCYHLTIKTQTQKIICPWRKLLHVLPKTMLYFMSGIPNSQMNIQILKLIYGNPKKKDMNITYTKL